MLVIRCSNCKSILYAEKTKVVYVKYRKGKKISKRYDRVKLFYVPDEVLKELNVNDKLVYCSDFSLIIYELKRCPFCGAPLNGKVKKVRINDWVLDLEKGIDELIKELVDGSTA